MTSKSRNAHLRAIRTAIASLALAIITAGLVINNDPEAFSLFLITILVLVYSFVPTIRDAIRSGG